MFLHLIVVALLLLLVGSIISLLWMRARRQTGLYAIYYPVFSAPPIRLLIDPCGRLRRFYLHATPNGFLIGTDLFEIRAPAAISGHLSYWRSRCETVFEKYEDAEKKVNQAILCALNQSNLGLACTEGHVIAANGAAYHLTLCPYTPDEAGVSLPSAWPSDLTLERANGPIEPMGAEAWFEQQIKQYKEFEKNFDLTLQAEKLSTPSGVTQGQGQDFILKLIRDSVVDGVTQTWQIQFLPIFENREDGTRYLEKVFSILQKRDPVFSECFYRSIRTPNGQTQRFFVHSQGEHFKVALEEEFEVSPRSKTVKQTLFLGLHPQRSLAEAEALKRFESYRSSIPLFTEPPVRMMLAPDGQYTRGHLGQVLEGYKAGIEFETLSGTYPNPLTYQEVLHEVWPTLEAAHAGLAAALETLKIHHPAFSLPPLRRICLMDGSMYQFYICPLREENEEFSSTSEHQQPYPKMRFPGAWNRSYLQYLQRALGSQFEAYRKKCQSDRGHGLGPPDTYNSRFSIAIERNTVEAELFLTVQTEMPDYSFSWSAQADLQKMIQQLLHQNPLFAGAPLKSITTAEGLTRHLHLGLVNDVFIIGIESNQTQGMTTVIRQLELADVHLDRSGAEQHLDHLFDTYRLAEGLFRTAPVREVVGLDQVSYRFFIAPCEGGFRIGIEQASRHTELKQTVLDQVFPDYNTAEIEAYRVRAKD